MNLTKKQIGLLSFAIDVCIEDIHHAVSTGYKDDEYYNNKTIKELDLIQYTLETEIGEQ